MHKYLTEFIGTFFLVLTIGLTSLSGSVLAPLAIGSSLMVMVYMGGHVSGGHYNPAVSLAVLIRGRLGVIDFVLYVVAQVIGALVAGVAVEALWGKPCPLRPAVPDATIPGLLVEILFTFALALVVLNAATAKKTEGNSFYGLAIGFTVMVGAFAGGNISGGAFNPAVGVGLTVVFAYYGAGNYSYLWLYLVGPLVGGALAALVFKIQEAGANKT
jgi:aquaporin Z